MKKKSIVFVLFLSCLFSVVSSGERLEAVEMVKIESAPFSVLVLCNRNKFFCTGTIMHPEWVLTSAHCLYDMSGEFTENDRSITVIAGTNKLNNSNEHVNAGIAQRRQSVKLEVQDSYTWAENFIYDLALIKLEKPLNMTDRVKVAPLFGMSLPKSNTDIESAVSFLCQGYGFGRVMRSTDNGNDYALKVQQYQMGKHCHCLEKVRSKRSPYNVLRKRNTWLCDEMASFTGLCLGDNGGQLICEDRLRAVATTLFHYKVEQTCTMWQDARRNECGDKASLNVFTDLCFHTQWMNRIVPDIPVTDDNCRSIKDNKRYYFF